MPDELISVDSIEIVGGVNSIDLNIDRGAEGNRGSYIIPWLGNPNDVTFPVYLTTTGTFIYPQTLDWYMNVDTLSDDYLCMYQLKNNGVWEFIFKMIPNVYHTNQVMNFTAGVGTVLVEVPGVALVLNQIYGSMDIPAVSESVDSLEEMLALDVTVNDYAYRTDTSSFYKAVSVPADTVGAWEKELTINLEVDFQNIYPIAKNFVIGKPYHTIDDDVKTYYFPITISGAEANPVSGWQALSGLKEAHISISVI